MSTLEDGFDEVSVEADGVRLGGLLSLPPRAAGLVVFVHGSGSSRHSPRNQAVARMLNSYGLGTLLFDLLTPAEEDLDELTGELRFDIPFLTRRTLAVGHFLKRHPRTQHLWLGFFGSSTGAAAALGAAALEPESLFAVVSRGGRPDLAAPYLDHVRAPTLFIVGGDDRPVIGLNQAAYRRLRCAKELAIVPGATHLFSEPGALEEVATLAAEWFVRHLPETDALPVPPA